MILDQYNGGIANTWSDMRPECLANAEFISQAPAIVRQLLEQNKQLLRENAELKKKESEHICASPYYELGTTGLLSDRMGNTWKRS